MSDISEAQTIEYFLQGIKKAKSAARELADFNSSVSWKSIRSTLGQIERNGKKLAEGKAQTHLGNLVLANQIAPQEH